MGVQELEETFGMFLFQRIKGRCTDTHLVDAEARAELGKLCRQATRSGCKPENTSLRASLPLRIESQEKAQEKAKAKTQEMAK